MNRCFISFILIIFLSLQSAIAYEEFYRDVTVDNNHWYFKRYTTNYTFNISGTLKGYGISIRNSYVGGFAGVNVKESEHARRGNIYITEKLTLDAKEGTSAVNENATDERYTIDYIESWPTKLESAKLFSYSGRGITLSEYYENNDDIIYTNANAKKMVSLSVYSTTLLGMKLYADITPNETKDSRIYNKNIDYFLKSRFQDGIFKFRYNSCLNKPNCVCVAENYYGDYTVEKKLYLKENFTIVNETQSNWLKCPD